MFCRSSVALICGSPVNLRFFLISYANVRQREVQAVFTPGEKIQLSQHRQYFSGSCNIRPQSARRVSTGYIIFKLSGNVDVRQFFRLQLFPSEYTLRPGKGKKSVNGTIADMSYGRPMTFWTFLLFASLQAFSLVQAGKPMGQFIEVNQEKLHVSDISFGKPKDSQGLKFIGRL